ncbi:hypothetical protein H8959_007754 [Pygathrix nigripes]
MESRLSCHENVLAKIAAARTGEGKSAGRPARKTRAARRLPRGSTGTKRQPQLRACLRLSAAGLPRGTGDHGARGCGARFLPTPPCDSSRLSPAAPPDSSLRLLPTPPSGSPCGRGSLRPPLALPRQVVRPRPPQLLPTRARGDESTVAREEERRGDGRGCGESRGFPSEAARGSQCPGRERGWARRTTAPPAASGPGVYGPGAAAREAARGRRRRQVSRGPPHPHRRGQEEEGTAAGPRGRGCPAPGARDLVRPKVDLTARAVLPGCTPRPELGPWYRLPEFQYLPWGPLQPSRCSRNLTPVCFTSRCSQNVVTGLALTLAPGNSSGPQGSRLKAENLLKTPKLCWGFCCPVPISLLGTHWEERGSLACGGEWGWACLMFQGKGDSATFGMSVIPVYWCFGILVQQGQLSLSAVAPFQLSTRGNLQQITWEASPSVVTLKCRLPHIHAAAS